MHNLEFPCACAFDSNHYPNLLVCFFRHVLKVVKARNTLAFNSADRMFALSMLIFIAKGKAAIASPCMTSRRAEYDTLSIA